VNRWAEDAMRDITKIIEFWLNDVGEDRWFVSEPDLDDRIRRGFQALWEDARAGGLADWGATAEGTLAYLILTDQFSRNMFRGDPRAFATDVPARAMGRQGIARGFDLATPRPQRVFFYLPFEHSEEMADQHWSVALMEARMPEESGGFPLHARAHRAIIERFGRFPFRNAALGRESTPEERAFMEAGGYGAIVRELGG